MQVSWYACCFLCLNVHFCAFASLKPPFGCRVSYSFFRDSLLIVRTTQDSARQHITPFLSQTRTNSKVTPPAVPETSFITRDLNLFTVPCMKGAKNLLFLRLQHHLPMQHLKSLQVFLPLWLLPNVLKGHEQHLHSFTITFGYSLLLRSSVEARCSEFSFFLSCTVA